MSYFSLQPKYISITKSYGVIPFTIKDGKILYLMIRRKNTFGYIDVIKGKYNINNDKLLISLIDMMTNKEKNDILNNNFETLWNNMWLYPNRYPNDTKKIFNNNITKIRKYIQESKTEWLEPEWEFPKGRKNIKESEIMCAKREFIEETGIKNISIINNVIPYDEMYIGNNLKCYKFKYFIGYISDFNIDISNFQKTEVSNVKWFTYAECIKHIRDYHYSKKKNLKNINYLIMSLRLI